MTHLCYADERMTKAQQICSLSALRYGANNSITMSINDIPSTYLDLAHPTILESRGAGYWVWKPIVIYNVLKDIPDGSRLIYTDSGLEIVGDLRTIGEREEDIFLFSNGFIHQHWCKGDVLDIFDQRNGTDYQCQASAIFLRKTPRAIQFIKEWMMWSLIPHLINDAPSIRPNHQEYREHRHDQALLTSLAIRDGIRLHWYPAKYLEKHKPTPQEDYPVLFYHHRKRNNEL